jgi:hypothetical protein
VLEPGSSAAAYLHGRAELLVNATLFSLYGRDKLPFFFVCVRRASLDREWTPRPLLYFSSLPRQEARDKMGTFPGTSAANIEKTGDDCFLNRFSPERLGHLTMLDLNYGNKPEHCSRLFRAVFRFIQHLGAFRAVENLLS